MEHSLQMSLADRMARFNRVITNPIIRTWAGRLPPWAIVEHKGRRSGREYRTPVSAFRRGQHITVPLAYGTRRDWVLNLEAAGGGTLVQGGKRIRVIDPEVRSGRVPLLHLRVADAA
jgi:deazaflavin-dependent oxidoreductase (nitroreductase family)